jgi:hypothetical protein
MSTDDSFDQGISNSVLDGDSIDHSGGDEELVLDINEMLG